MAVAVFLKTLSWLFDDDKSQGKVKAGKLAVTVWTETVGEVEGLWPYWAAVLKNS